MPQTHGHRAGGCDCRRMPEVFSGGVGTSPSQGCSEHELMEETVRVAPGSARGLGPIASLSPTKLSLGSPPPCSHPDLQGSSHCSLCTLWPL